MAYLQPKIPEHVEDELDDAFAPGRLLERAHEEKVDVRSGCKLAAAITAGRDDGNSLGVRRILRVVEVFGGEIVDHLDGRILQRRESARRRKSAKGSRLDTGLDPGTSIQECTLDQRERLLAQTRLVG
jgi:hypothetical protein